METDYRCHTDVHVMLSGAKHLFPHLTSRSFASLRMTNPSRWRPTGTRRNPVQTHAKINPAGMNGLSLLHWVCLSDPARRINTRATCTKPACAGCAGGRCLDSLRLAPSGGAD